MVEIYQAYADYNDLMHLTETIVSQTAQKVLGTMKISYEGQEIDLTPPWNRMTMIEAVAKYTGQDFSGIKDLDEARKMADAINVPYEKTFGIGKIINACFEEHVEEKLIQPTFITGHPKEISPLAKSSEADPENTALLSLYQSTWTFQISVCSYAPSYNHILFGHSTILPCK